MAEEKLPEQRMTLENVGKLREWCDEAELNASEVLMHGEYIRSI